MWKLRFNIILIFIAIFIFSCNSNHGGKGDGGADSANFYDTASKYPSVTNQLDYPYVPDPEDYYKSRTGLRLIDTLESRFTKNFIAFKEEVEASHAKLYVCYITPEVGAAATRCESEEKPFIKNLCEKHHVPFVDFTDVLANRQGITFMPIDGHFNKRGAMLVATKISDLIDNNKSYRSDITYPASSIPALLGDEDPGIDRIVEDKRGLPYKLVTNEQGLRMDGVVEFPKKKQHVLLMGDSEIYGLGVDNPETITGVLQKRHPDKTIINAAKWAYTIDDELSQWKERTKYQEPDIVLLELNGVSITNLYFSQKIRFHRPGNLKIFNPSPLEKKFYYSKLN
jgi:hypothetical protein